MLAINLYDSYNMTEIDIFKCRKAFKHHKKTIQGLLTYMKSQFSQDELREKGIVVGFDARYNSSTWGRLTAQIFAQHGVKVRIFKDIVPTPYVAFNVRKC